LQSGPDAVGIDIVVDQTFAVAVEILYITPQAPVNTVQQNPLNTIGVSLFWAVSGISD